MKHVYATIDYEDDEGQFCDRGRSYSPAIYFKTEEERLVAERLAPETSVNANRAREDILSCQGRASELLQEGGH